MKPSPEDFASRLERLDVQIAEGETQQVGGPLENVGKVLDLINRVRRRDADTDEVNEVTIASDMSTSIPVKSKQRSSIDLAGQPIDSYMIEEQIARGGMGVVFRARDTQLDRTVALKMMVSGPLADAEERRRFCSEAESAARLDHPGIVPIYDVGEFHGQPYFTMALIEGESLSDRIRRCPLDPFAATEIAAQITAAIEYAHAEGVIHRDIKPSNVVLSKDGRAKLTDFGLARRVDSDRSLTGTAQVLGTPSYMAPEQAGGESRRAGPQADVYAIGATLYCMLTGRPPFQAPGTAETLRLVLEREPVAPRELDPSIPKDLNTICLQCLQKNPARRYQSAEALRGDLLRFANHEAIHARPVGWSEKSLKWARKHPLISGLSIAVALSIGVIIVGGLLYQTELNRTLGELRVSQSRAVDHLYHSLTAEAAFLNDSRPIGYGPHVREVIAQAHKLDSRHKDLFSLRQLAISGIGYVGERQQMVFPEVDGVIRAANVVAETGQLIVGDQQGAIIAFDLTTQQRLQRIDVLGGPVVRIDVVQSNRGRTGKRIRVIGEFVSEIATLVYDGDRGLSIESVVSPNVPSDFLGIELTPDARYLIGVQPVSPSMRKRGRWLTPSTYVPGDAITEGRGLVSNAKPPHFAVKSLVDEEAPPNRLPFPISPRFDVSDHYLAVGYSWLDDRSIEEDIAVYNLHSGEVDSKLDTSCGALLSVRISQNGQRVAAGSRHGFEVFERYSGDRLTRNDELGACLIEDLSRDGSEILVRTDRASRLYSSRNRIPIAHFSEVQDSTLCFAVGGRYLLASNTNLPRVIDTRGDHRIRISAHSMIAKSVSFSADSRFLATSTRFYGGNLSGIWDATTGQQKFEFAGAETVFSPDAKWIAAWAQGRIKLWDVATGRLADSTPFVPFPQSLRFSDDSKRLVAAAENPGDLAVWQLETGDGETADPVRLHPILSDESGSAPVALSPSGGRIAYRTGVKVRVKSLNDDTLDATLDPDANLRVDCLGFRSEDDLFIATGRLQVWDVSKAVRTSVTDQRYLPPIAFAPDRSHLVCRRSLVDAHRLRTVFELPAWLGSTASAGWSPDGSRIAYGLDSGEVTLWNVRSIHQSMVEQSLPATRLIFQDSSPNPLIDQMVDIGVQLTGQTAPEQWNYRFHNLIDQIDRGADQTWIVREVNWLSERIGGIATRPFFEQASNQADTLDRMRNVYQLSRTLHQLQEYEAERKIVSRMLDEVQHLHDDSIEFLRNLARLQHALGDLHNYFLPNHERCLAAYLKEEDLLNRIEQRSGNLDVDLAFLESRYWLNRNLAFAFGRQGDLEQAIRRMTSARLVSRKNPDLNVDATAYRQDEKMLNQWNAKQAAGRSDRPETSRSPTQ